jgi:hypothetical protein
MSEPSSFCEIAVEPVLVTEVRSLMMDVETEPADAGSIDPWYSKNLVCPIDRTTLHFDGRFLVSMRGSRYPGRRGNTGSINSR